MTVELQMDAVSLGLQSLKELTHSLRTQGLKELEFNLGTVTDVCRL